MTSHRDPHPIFNSNATTSGSIASTTDPSQKRTNPIKATVAAVHGAGDVLAGGIKRAMDKTSNSKETGTNRTNDNERQMANGIDEMTTGKFGVDTKAREGFAGRGAATGTATTDGISTVRTEAGAQPVMDG